MIQDLMSMKIQNVKMLRNFLLQIVLEEQILIHSVKNVMKFVQHYVSDILVKIVLVIYQKVNIG